MNSSESRSSEFPRSSGKSSPENLKQPIRPLPPPPPTPAAASASPPETEDELAKERQEPIPPPSHPRQYRAIGLILGQYQRSEDQLTRGTLITSDGTAIEAVLLGRVISLVKNHLNLEEPHLWVVYPRTRQEDDRLHIQIVGVWEPETLNKEKTSETDSTPTSAKTENGYFSIRGEVVYYAHDKEVAIVKIRQSPKRETERPKFFKLKLKGTLPDRPVGHFWDLQVQLEADVLAVKEAEDLGQLFRKKKPFPPRKPGRGGPRFERSDRPSRSDRPERPEKPRFSSDDRGGDKPSGGGRSVIPKPTQRKEKES